MYEVSFTNSHLYHVLRSILGCSDLLSQYFRSKMSFINLIEIF